MKKFTSAILVLSVLFTLLPGQVLAAGRWYMDEVELPAEVTETPLGEEVPALPVDPPADSDEFPAQLAEGRRAVVASGNCGNGVTGRLYDDGELYISGTGAMTDYTSSTDAPWYASYRNRITSVVIDSGVTSIGYSAFSGCSSLASIDIPKSVTSIGSDAFFSCSSLTSVVIPKGVTSIQQYAFGNCSSLASIVIPEGVTSIWNGTFFCCSSLTSIVIPESVTHINHNAFDHCSSLNSIVYIGTEAQWGKITIGSPNTDLTSAKRYYVSSEAEIVHATVSNCENGHVFLSDYYFPIGTSVTVFPKPTAGYKLDTVYIDGQPLEGRDFVANGNHVVSATFAPTQSPVVDSGSCGTHMYWYLYEDGELYLTGSGDMAYYSSNNSIPWYAEYRDQITSVVIDSGIRSIRRSAFSGCSNLTKIEAAQGNSCYTSLDGVLLNKEGTTIEAYPTGKTGDYVIPECVTAIGRDAFSGCSTLTSITIPDGITSIGSNAFSGCSSLTTAGPIGSGCNIEFGWTTQIPASAFSGCTSLTSITIPDSVTSIGYRAFDGCSALSSITIPGSVTSIGSDAFSGCLSLTTAGPIGSGCNIEFGWTTQIPASAFSGCTSLTGITIPESVTGIGEDTFYGCSALTNITIPDSVTSIGYRAFDSCSKLTTAGPIGSGCNIEFGWTTQIPSNAFRNCSALTSITIPGSVTSIGSDAFSGCTKLTTAGPIGSGCNIEFGWTTDIPSNVFGRFPSLTRVTIPGSVTSIGSYALSDCSNLTNIEVAEDNSYYTSLDGVLFSKDLSTLIAYPAGKRGKYTIPSGVTSIGGRAFSSCSVLTSIAIPEGVTSIGGSAFYGCSALTSITIPSGVTSIENWTFCKCTSLTSITIPNSVTSIGYFAFSDCSKLTSVYYAGTKAQWESASDSEVKSRIPGKAEVTVLLYEINYAPGEATGEMETQIAKKDVAFTLPACTFTPPSEMIFKTWRIDNAEYAPGEAVMMEADTTVTAVWQNCEHRFSVVENITTPPTCGAAGSKDVTRTCDVCGYVATSVETIPATGLHTYSKTDESVTLEPTCVDTGRRKNTFTCGVCGHSYTEDETIPATGKHTYTQTREEMTLEPTCVETGIREYTFTCEVCNHSYTEQETIPATGVHDFTLLEEKVITPETCKNEGLKRVTTLCTMCGERRSHDEVLPIVDHTYGPFVILTAPSGSAVGTGEKTCTVCGHTVTVTLCQIIYNAWGSATTMDSRVVEANTLFTLPACSLTGPEGQRFQGWGLLGNLYSPGDQITVTENLVLTPRWAYETVEVPFTTRSYPSTVTVYRGQPVRAELPSNDIVTSYTVFDEGQTKLFSNTYHMWTADTSLGNFIPDQPGTYTLQYTLSKYTETTMNVDGTMQTVKRPTGEPETYTRTIVVRVPAAAFYCAAQPDGSILVHIEHNRFPGSGTVYLASYSANGQLLELKSLSIADLSQGCSRAVAIKTERGGYYKAFLLNSDSGCPLTEAVVGTDL